MLFVSASKLHGTHCQCVKLVFVVSLLTDKLREFVHGHGVCLVQSLLISACSTVRLDVRVANRRMKPNRQGEVLLA